MSSYNNFHPVLVPGDLNDVSLNESLLGYKQPIVIRMVGLLIGPWTSCRRAAAGLPPLGQHKKKLLGRTQIQINLRRSVGTGKLGKENLGIITDQGVPCMCKKEHFLASLSLFVFLRLSSFQCPWKCSQKASKRKVFHLCLRSLFCSSKDQGMVYSIL